MTTSEYDADSVPPDDDFAMTIEAPLADAVDQRTPVGSTDETGSDLPADLPDGVNPADALEQARTVVTEDDDL